MADRKKISNIKIEGARLIFKNFQGKGNDFNKEGDRNFGVLIPDDMVEVLQNDGWNIKFRPPRPDDGYEQPWLSVKVKYGKYPPIVTLINSSGKMRLDEESVGQLDWTRIKTSDIIIRPYSYDEIVDKKGNVIRSSGVAAYLQALYVTVLEDDFASKYADIPDIDKADDTEDEMPFNED